VEPSFCKLTLVVPSDADERIIELMLASDPPVNGFTMWQADGHGESFKTANLGERVRGRVERSVFIAVMGLSRAKSLVDEIGRKAPIPHMAYWIEPVLEFGRTAAVTRQDDRPGAAS
jgi:Protein of unknown function (DUF3240)